jgi:transcriptional regulator with XRE-family HTH domain
MVLLRRVIGDALRARRQGQHRTLREVSTAANVSLGYLSEIERGQKEASSELLAAICDALGASLSELLGEVSSTLALAEGMDGVLVPVETGAPAGIQSASVQSAPVRSTPVQSAPMKSAEASAVRQVATDGKVSVSVRQDTPLKATLRATRKRDRDVVYAA